MILVTGASGFIGSALVAALRRAGAPVRAAYRIAPAGEADAVSVGDIGPMTDWRAALDGAETVIHLAGTAHARASDEQLERVNVAGLRCLASAASAAGARRFIFVSSVKAAADYADHTLVEAETPWQGTSYGRAKHAGEEILLEHSALNSVILRPPLVLGAGAKANAAALLRLADTPLPLPLARFQARRSYMALSTLVAALMRTALHSGPHGVFFVAERESFTIGALVATLRRGLGRSPRLFAARVPAPTVFREQLVVDDSAFRAAYGYGEFTARSAQEALADAARAWKASRRK